MAYGNVKDFVRSLLDRTVMFPGNDPNNPDGAPIEISHRLEVALRKNVRDVLFCDDDEETMSTTFGKNWKQLRDDYDSLSQSLVILKSTGRIDQTVIDRGCHAVTELIATVSRMEKAARADLDPNDEFLRTMASTKTHRDPAEQIARQLNDRYLSYLCFRCSRDALETLQQGLRDIVPLLEQPNSRRSAR